MDIDYKLDFIKDEVYDLLDNTKYSSNNDNYINISLNKKGVKILKNIL